MQFTASDTKTAFNAWIFGSEYDRRIDPVRKVFNFLTDVSTNYDTRTDVTYEYGLYSTGISQGAGNLQYPINSPKSLPLFDVWRQLNEFEFHEFVSSFNNSLFQKLMENKYRGLQLYYMLNSFPEKTYLHKYVEGHPTWDVNGSFGGTITNPRDASGVQFIEDSLFMDTVKERDC